MNKEKVAIIGGGFSGLTLAWALSKKNIPVEIFESSGRFGGMLGTKYEGILVEQAANALLASASVEKLFSDIGVKPVKAGFRSKKRWIFRRGPKKFPFKFSEIFSGLSNIILAKLRGSLKPVARESLSQWTARILNKNYNDYLVSPAFQGIYGTTSDNLSASLVLNAITNKKLKNKKGKWRGSVSAEGGMQALIDGLVRYLRENQMTVHTNSNPEVSLLQKQFRAVVVATSAEQACHLLSNCTSETAAKIKSVPVLPLATVTLKYKNDKKIKGFGCLFPAPEKFNSLGVLFNSDIFPLRGDFSETWIFNDIQKSDAEFAVRVAEDRQRLTAENEVPEAVFVKTWPKALPLYGIELENLLQEEDFSSGLEAGVRLNESKLPLYLTGNYLGVIGLAKILEYNIRLAERMAKELS